MEVESGSHRGQTILLSAGSTSTKPPTIATQLSLALQHFAFTGDNRTHPTPNRRENDVKN